MLGQNPNGDTDAFRSQDGHIYIRRDYSQPIPVEPPRDPLAGFIRELTSSQRATALGAFETAVEAVIDAAGPTDAGVVQRARGLVARHAHNLALNADEVPVLLVEHPVFPEMRDFTDASYQDGSTESERFVRSHLVPIALDAAVPLLLGAEDPEAELDRRRVKVAAAKESEAKDREERLAKERADREARQLWERQNARRLAKWAALSRRDQCLHLLADRFPQFGDLVRGLIDAERATGSDRVLGEMPASFDQEPDVGWWETESATTRGDPR